MRVLILSFYYPPDLSAGSYRTGALVEALQKALSETDTMDVVTTSPNRYHSYEVTAPAHEQRGNLHIWRESVPTHRSGMIDQILSFAAFAAKALWFVRRRRYDVVYATTSRLFTGFLGAVIARRKRLPLYLDVRDIFTETMFEVLDGLKARLLAWPLGVLERFTIRSAARVNLVSEGFLDYFGSRYPGKEYSLFSNGIDDEFLVQDFRKPLHAGPTRVLYAGNVGDGQALHRIIPQLASTLGEQYEFVVVGDGSARGRLEAEIKGIRNVRVLPPVGRTALMQYYREADVLFLHLEAYRAFLRVLPSKLFEYAATGKPILAGVGGHAAEFIISEIPNAETFPPGDVDGAIAGLQRLKLHHTQRDAFARKYRRGTITAAMAEEVVACARGSRLVESGDQGTSPGEWEKAARH